MSSAQRKSRCNEQGLRAVLTRQHGLVTSRQAQELGVTAPSLTRRVQRGQLARVHPRVYRSTVVSSSLSQRALAAVLWIGADAVLSHTTAGALWRIEDVESGGIELWLPGSRSPRATGVTVHRGNVASTDRRLRDGVALTSPARTLIDLAGVLDDEQLESALEDVLRRGLTTAPAIRRRLDALGGKGRAGSVALRRMLDERGGGVALESRLEVKVSRMLRRAGLRPVRQYDVRCGDRRYRLDFAFPAQKIAIEADGFATHGGRRAFVRDGRRRADLAAAGWIVIPVTWDDCTSDPAGVVERIGSALLRAA